MRPVHVPERSCIACGQKLAKRELMRIVRTPQGQVVVDATGKLPGRGAYLCRAPSCWDTALKGDRLSHALKGPVAPRDREQLVAYARESLPKEPVTEEKA